MLNNHFTDQELIVQGIDARGYQDAGVLQPGFIKVDGIKIIGVQSAAISGSLTDAQKVTAILAALRVHGLIKT